MIIIAFKQILAIAKIVFHKTEMKNCYRTILNFPLGWVTSSKLSYKFFTMFSPIGIRLLYNFSRVLGIFSLSVGNICNVKQTYLPVKYLCMFWTYVTSCNQNYVVTINFSYAHIPWPICRISTIGDPWVIQP